MPIQGVNLADMPREKAIRLLARLYGVGNDVAQQMVAAELGKPFDNVIKPGTIPALTIKQSGSTNP